MKERALRVMEFLSKNNSYFAKFLRIQRSIAALPIIAVYVIVGSYFTKLNFFRLNFFLGAIALYLISVAVNGYNNLFDIEEDKLAISSKIVKSNYLLNEFTWSQLKWNFAITSIALAIILIIIRNLEFAVLCAFTFILGIIYTKPIRLKNIPIIGTFSNTYGFSILPVLSSFFLLNGDLRTSIAFILSIFLPVFVSCLIAEIADREIDKQIGTRTTARWLGKHIRLLFKIVLILSFVLYFAAFYIHWAVVLVTPFVAAILYDTFKLYIDFAEKKADYALIRIGANISRGLIIYIIAAIIIRWTAPDIINTIF